MTTRPSSYLSTSPDHPPPEDLHSWLPPQLPAHMPSPFLGAEQVLLSAPESPSSQFVPLANTEQGDSSADITPTEVTPTEITPTAPPSSQAKGKGKAF